jgi:cytoskeletal protein RodZ
MKVFLATVAAILLLFAVTSVPAYSQDREEDKPDAKAANHQDEVKPQQEKDKDKDNARRDEKATKPEEKSRGQEAPARPEQNRPEAARPEGNRTQEQHEQPHQMASDRERPQQAQHGKRIPDEKFRASFGRQHTFHVQRERVINVAQPVVVYGGYSFQLVDSWPAQWAFDDDCYIDYVDDGYYLFNPRYPGFRVAVIVVGY